MLIYRGQASDLSQMSEEQQKAVLDHWQKWIGTVGSALVDVGSPFGGSSGVVDDGTTRQAHALSGYSIVEAASPEDAKKHASVHPFLSEGQGNFGIDIYELMPTPF
jgi:hypothetical protein